MTMPRRYTDARNNLRRGRIQEALNIPLGADVGAARDTLLQLLLEAADSDDIEFEALNDWQVDSICSIAQANIVESKIDEMLVLLLCIRILAKDGQFARLRTLAEKLELVAIDVLVDRPFLGTACTAIAWIVKSRDGDARSLARQALGMDGLSGAIITDRTSENLHDSLALAAVYNLSSERDFALIERIRNVSFRNNDPVLLSVVDAADSVCRAADVANASKCLMAADRAFASPSLSEYIRTRSITTLLPAQSLAIREGVTLDEDRVVALPTSSGKTFIAELRIAACLHRQPGATAIYVAPYRLLARQVERSLRSGLSVLGIKVIDLGGSYDPSVGQLDQFSQADVGIATPEKLDSLLRLSTTNRPGSEEAKALLSACRILVFDEIQLIGRQGRGHRFELIMTRLRMLYPAIKVLGLAAASFGTDMLASWVSGHAPITGAKRPTGTVEIRWDPNGRMMQRVGGVSSRIAMMERSSAPADDATRLVLQFSRSYMPILAVETSRPLAEGLARRIVRADREVGSEWRAGLAAEIAVQLDDAIAETKTILGEQHPLADFLRQGVAYHHAGLPSHILRHIETLAELRALRVVCSTTTVAEGADLPFRVVVIPHLNFAGESRKLQRDLYQNIIGRAGRVNVAMEGIVFVLESAAPTLRNLVTTELWSSSPPGEISGTLTSVIGGPRGAGTSMYEDVKTQVLAWIGESGAGIEEQAEVLSASTLTARRSEGARRATSSTFRQALSELEEDGLAISASPYALTDLGSRSRLAGLSAFSCLRLNGILTGDLRDLPVRLMGSSFLSDQDCDLVSYLAFQSLESLEQSVWMKVNFSAGNSADLASRDLALSRMPWPDDDNLYLDDIRLLSAWMSGVSFSDLGQMAPVIPGNNGIFRGDDTAKRASDAAEYIGRVTFSAAWTWSAIKSLIGPRGDDIPGYIRQCIEYGCRSESAIQLIRLAGLTRNSANTVSEVIGYDWESSRNELVSSSPRMIDELQIADLDRTRLQGLRRQLVRSN